MPGLSIDKVIREPVKLSAPDATLIAAAIQRSPIIFLSDKKWMIDVLINGSEEYR